MTFLNKSHSMFYIVDESVIITMICEGLNCEDNDQSMFIDNRNNNDDNYVVSDDSESVSTEESILGKKTKICFGKTAKKKLKLPLRPLSTQRY